MEKEISTQIAFLQYLNMPISRLGTGSEKYDLRKKMFGTEDVLPMWVADMDLPIAPFITEALYERIKHPILGYTLASDKTFQAVIKWHQKKGLICTKQNIQFTHNVANGFFMAIHAFSNPGDSILVQTPVYPPFLKATGIHDRKCIESPLELINNQYLINFEQFELAIIQNKIKLFLLCNPQNPSGRVWLKDELSQLAQICLKHSVTIISDEIHSSLINKGLFTSMASLSKEVADITVTLDSPGKTFNLGGLQIGYAIIQNTKLLKQFKNIKAEYAIEDLNLFAMTALEAAYSHPDSFTWIDSVQTVIKQNLEYLITFLEEYYPSVKLMKPDASYLVWLNFKAYFKTHEQTKYWLINQAKLGLNDGKSFSNKNAINEGFMRMNIAVPKETIIEACNRLKQALSKMPA